LSLLLLASLACLASVAYCDDAEAEFLKHIKVYNFSAGGENGMSFNFTGWRVRGTGSLTPRLYNAILPGGDLIVGYTDGEDHAHVMYLKKDREKGYRKVRDINIYPTMSAFYHTRGVVPLKDGSFAVLLWREASKPGANRLWLQKWSQMNETTAPEKISERNVIYIYGYPTGSSDYRMEVDDDGYFYVYSHVYDSTHTDRAGDMYSKVDSNASGMSQIWTFGCDHPMSSLLRYHPILNDTLCVCITDCYPGTEEDANITTDSIGGIYTEKENLIYQMAGGCNGCVGGELGMVAPLYDGGWVMNFNSHRNDVGKGQAACNSSYNQDVGLAFIAPNKQRSGDIIWLTNTPGDEYDPALARYGPFCGKNTCKDFGEDGQKFLVGWKEGTTSYLGLMKADGTMALGPFDVSRVNVSGVMDNITWGSRDDTWRTRDDGSVVWLCPRGGGISVYVFEYGDPSSSSESSTTPSTHSSTTPSGGSSATPSTHSSTTPSGGSSATPSTHSSTTPGGGSSATPSTHSSTTPASKPASGSAHAPAAGSSLLPCVALLVAVIIMGFALL